nr:symplekin isoform X1 [Tanacetum cinerariifolium]
MLQKPEVEGEQPATKDSDVVHSPQASPMEEELVPAGPPVSVNIPSVTVIVPNISLVLPSEDTDIGELEYVSFGVGPLESSAHTHTVRLYRPRAIAMKLPMDLNNSMPGHVDQVSKAGSMAFMCTMMANAETLRDSFPPNDKSLTRLLSEVPYLPKPVLKFLESLCVPGNSEKDAELHSGERVHQGLSIVWSIILLRPPSREPATKDSDVVHSPQASPMEEDLVPAGPPVSVNIPSVSVTNVTLAIPSEDTDIGELEDGIPGLDSSARDDGMPEIQVDAEMISADMEENNQEQITKMGMSSTDIVPSMPTDSLTDEQKDHIQKLAFTHIVEAYKHIAVAGGSQLRFSLLSYLGVEFPLELDPWSHLHTHILSDYTGHEGHELTLRVLFRLFGEAEADHDFFSSTTATSVYEIFLLKVPETLRYSFPPNDKSLTRLLSEVPYLPKPVLKLLESLCVPRNSEKDVKLYSGERECIKVSALFGA